jgi:hypothetical protein
MFVAGNSEARNLRPHFLWIGPLIAIPAFFSYYVFFAQWPVFRDTAWLNIGLLLGALALSVLGLRSVWARGVLLRVGGVASVLVSGAFATMLILYCYVLSYGLPSDEEVVRLGERLPAISLVSDTGETVDLAAAGESLILVFYRGFW